jgi:ribosomal protein S18 acetylase RimI-like enzyme
MEIVKTKIAELEILKSWFPDQESSYRWCGPNIRFPFAHETFIQDIRWGKMPTYSLLDDKSSLIGFGQYQERLQRCHLARLVIAPSLRAKGFGKKFIAELMHIGMSDLGVNECSLFVFSTICVRLIAINR